MLHLEKVEKRYGATIILSGTDLVIHPGEKVGLIGLNGMGKTTLFRIIEEVEPLDGGRLDRHPPHMRIGVLRQELTPAHRSILQETLGGLPQLVALNNEREALHSKMVEHPEHDAYHQWVMRLGEVDHALEDLDAYSAEARAGAILLGLGFSTADLEKPLDAFSGGWRMRVALAQLLFSAPDLMLLDEPTNHLDLESVAWLERYLAGLSGAYMLISHDRDFLQRTTRVTVELEDGKLTRYKGSFDAYMNWKIEQAELLSKQAAKQADKLEAMQRFISRFRAKATKAKQVQSRVKQMEKLEAQKVELPGQGRSAPVIRLPDPPPCASQVMKIDKMSMAYGSTQVFKNCQLEISKGSRIGLLGPNGRGKSTLLKLLCGALQPTAGVVMPGDRVKPGFFAQHALESLRLGDTILESAREVAPPGTTETQLRTVLGGLLFSGQRVEKLVSVLSGGEKARLALARLFLSGANFLLLDEPTNHLDMPSRAALEEALESYQGTFVLVSHDRSLLESVCDRYVAIAQDQLHPLGEDLDHYLEHFVLQETASQPNGVQDKTTARALSKESKREAAQIRNALHQRTKPLRSQLNQCEKNIQQLEADKTRIDATLTDSSLYEEGQKERLKNLLESSTQTEQALSKAWALWETLSMEIETLEEQAKQALEQA
ncbi:ABC transporter related protein [Magnetococcus marinus MC-1]|uniref:ABC transporter related protein n=1 Tax=Magnetococcus marinus (strain ATCC BAA-1437 / JCM 17883 / MC-1) TaxID=156889 RepID=A0L9I3_MAGMM|nr:ABC-F family ATP-binding cassette domain-containing protein [Magnetococcus marinus]ABK44626.1 ABC transporter related protein [Magnetococcus marinus MC-1]